MSYIRQLLFKIKLVAILDEILSSCLDYLINGFHDLKYFYLVRITIINLQYSVKIIFRLTSICGTHFNYAYISIQIFKPRVQQTDSNWTALLSVHPFVTEWSTKLKVNSVCDLKNSFKTQNCTIMGNRPKSYFKPTYHVNVFLVY